MHIFECFRKFNSVLMAILAGAAPQREAMELPSAKPRGGEPAVHQPILSRTSENQTVPVFPLSSSALLPPKLLVYIGKQGGFARDFL